MKCNLPAKLIFPVLLLASAHAQPTTFDVASVKPSPPSETDRININLGVFNHGVVTLGNTTLSECVRWAYGLVSEDQIDGPDWIRDRSLRVDITAKTAPDTPLEQAHRMIQNLLVERFHLELHHASKPVRHFELSVSAKGPKLPVSPEGGRSGLVEYRPGRLYYDHIPVRTLTVLLSRQLKEPVLDLTGIDGVYNIRLDWMLEDQSARQEPSNSAPPPDLFHAVEQQLGLHIEEKKTPIDILVIDRADKVPIAN